MLPTVLLTAFLGFSGGAIAQTTTNDTTTLTTTPVSTSVVPMDNSSTTTAGVSTTSASTPSQQQLAKDVSSALLAGAWIPFAIVAGVAFVVSLTYVKFFQHKREKECSSTLVSVSALTVALMTLALLPVDIFLVSQQHLNADATYHFSADQVDAVQHITTDAYYAMYALLILFAFVLLPLSYFFFESKDEEAGTTTCKRLVTAALYTSGFLVFMAILLLIGAFAVNKNVPDCASNNTKAYAKCQGKYAEESITTDSGTNATSFTIGVCALIGFVYFAFYTASGLVTMPIKMIRQRGRNKSDVDDANLEINSAKEQQSLIRNKYKGRSKNMSSKDRTKLLNYQERERVVSRAVARADEVEGGACGRLGTCCAPFQFVFGVVFFLFSIFLMVSLLMTVADKLLEIENENLGFKTGYSRTKNKPFYPVDKMLTMAVGAFPVDYILITFLVYYFVFATMSGVRAWGVRFCHLRMFKIRPRRTVPQGMLFFAFILMFTLIAMNVVLLTLAPQYVTYGNQKTINLESCGASDDQVSFAVVSDCEMVQCSGQAPPQAILRYTNVTTEAKQGLLVFPNASLPYDSFINGTWGECDLDTVSEFLDAAGYNVSDMRLGTDACDVNDKPCVQTRVAALLHSFFYNFWFLGAIYYWAMWLSLGVYFVSLIYYTCKNRKSLVQAMINDIQDDLDDSDDDDGAPFKPSWGSSA
eukprot:m.97109 g.97109  ORF g.97109 m.97109 type:complete len:699 (+) comp16687_c0_seq1:153-2249(+)